MYSQFWDITFPLKQGMTVWPGDTPFTRTVRNKTVNGMTWSNSELFMGAHTGTHMDAPCHAVYGADDIAAIPISVLIGPARVVVCDQPMIDEAFVKSIAPLPGERILFRTVNTDRVTEGVFHRDFVHLDEGAAALLVKNQVVLVGTDGPSVDPIETATAPCHTLFCGARIAVIENLFLRDVTAGEYDLICLPMKLEGSDGAPVRAVLAR